MFTPFQFTQSISLKAGSLRLFATGVALIAVALTSISAKAHHYPNDDGLRCLTENIYHEARGESDSGKLAVALVTLNRVKSKHFPKTICKVVWQPRQFSWTASAKNLNKAPDNKNWRKAVMIAKLAIAGARHSAVGDATHYHADYVSPRWAKAKTPVATIGTHLFYIL